MFPDFEKREHPRRKRREKWSANLDHMQQKPKERNE